MGDVLRTNALLGPLKRVLPNSHVTWITRSSSAPLLVPNPLIDRVLTIDSGYLEYLLCEDFDLALGPDADPLSACIMQLARAGTKRGFVSDRRGGVFPLNAAAESWWQLGLNDTLKRHNRTTYGEWLLRICELPGPVERPWFQPGQESKDRIAAFLQKRAGDARSRICINTGASGRWREKRWTADHYRRFAEEMAGDWPGTAVILTGGPEEADFNREILAGAPHLINGGCDHSMEDFSALIAACDWVLTPDSLGYHIACAVGIPAVCLVGPTSPWELDHYAANCILYSDLDCIGCYLHRCPFSINCMGRLTPASIMPWIAAESGRSAIVSGVHAVPAARIHAQMPEIQIAAPRD